MTTITERGDKRSARNTPKRGAKATPEPNAIEAAEPATLPQETSPEAAADGGLSLVSGRLMHLDIDRIAPSYLNPRKHFDEQSLTELAESIRQHGLLQPIVVRPATTFRVEPDNRREDRFYVIDTRRIIQGGHGPESNTYDGHYESYESRVLAEAMLPQWEIIAGERRYRACRRASLETVPCLVRDDVVDDRKHVELALLENLVREEIDPIEEAQGYQQLRAMGMTQEQIADRVNRSRSGVANTERLLKLPNEVQQQISAKTLSPSHGVALLKYEAFPQLIAALTERIARLNIPAHAIEKGIGALEHTVRRGLIDDKAIVELGYAGEFNWNKVCRTSCPFKAFVPGSYDGQGYCLKPEHFKELTEAARKEAKEKAEKELAKLAAQGDQFLNADKLQFGQYESLRRSESIPAGCTEACACRRMAAYSSGNQAPFPVCIDPKRFKKLTLEDEQAKRGQRELLLIPLREQALTKLREMSFGW